AGGVVLLLGIAAGAAGVNSYVGYFPTLHSFSSYVAGGPNGGLVMPGGGGSRQAPGQYPSQIVVDRLDAPQLGVRPGRLYVYLPPRYADPSNAKRRDPLVYLL